jgi:hypothetical protein
MGFLKEILHKKERLVKEIEEEKIQQQQLNYMK